MASSNDIVLQVDDLQVHFHGEGPVSRAVDGATFTIREAETVCIVGESGCGKTVTALAVMGLLSQPPARLAGGRIFFQGQSLLDMAPSELRALRGTRMAMVFQEPMTSLNPVFTIGNQIGEAILVHEDVAVSEARRRTIQLLADVGIADPEKRVDDYPHQLSGGQRQRAMIAMALACGPTLMIADEPTTALDVTIQAQVLELMKRLRNELGMAILLITHDLGVVAEMADRVSVMYAGKNVEEGLVEPIFERPLHPYTRGLLDSIPQLHRDQVRLHAIDGGVPNPSQFPKGCRFHPRCQFAQDRCRAEQPVLTEVEPGHKVSCWYPLVAADRGVA